MSKLSTIQFDDVRKDSDGNITKVKVLGRRYTYEEAYQKGWFSFSGAGVGAEALRGNSSGTSTRGLGG